MKTAERKIGTMAWRLPLGLLGLCINEVLMAAPLRAATAASTVTGASTSAVNVPVVDLLKLSGHPVANVLISLYSIPSALLAATAVTGIFTTSVKPEPPPAIEVRVDHSFPFAIQINHPARTCSSGV